MARLNLSLSTELSSAPERPVSYTPIDFVGPLLMSLLLFIPGFAAAAGCDAAESKWAPGEYYDRDAIVVFDGQWYQAQERHSGRQPTTGIFTWKRIESPSCAHEDNATPKEISEAGVPDNSPPAKPDLAPAPQRATDSQSGKPVSSRKQGEGKMTDQAAAETHHCDKAIPEFSFGQSHLVGQRVRHEGQVYRAIRPTNGVLPTQEIPHHWERAEQPCNAH